MKRVVWYGRTGQLDFHRPEGEKEFYHLWEGGQGEQLTFAQIIELRDALNLEIDHVNKEKRTIAVAKINANPCETCSQPSTGWVVDSFKSWADEFSKLIPMWKPGPQHFYCQEHMRESKTYDH